ncbi:MAG: hypothetical protein H7Z75_09370 [Ferruginibacter sp.]|nr:hypothetical protein [Cytophagales bacterium]
MENNPMDRLFAEKLRLLEKTPDALVWNRLQARKPPARKGFFVRYGIAASVSALLLAGGLVWRYQNQENRVEARRDPRVASRPPVRRERGAATGMEARSKRTDPSVNPGRKAVSAVRKKPKLSVPVAAPQSKNALTPEQPTRLPDQSPVTTPSLLAMAEPVAGPAAVVVVRIAEPMPTVSGWEPPAPTGERTGTGVRKKTRAGKIIQQLKNLKNGEKVDWKAVGIRPEGILARAKPERENQK